MSDRILVNGVCEVAHIQPRFKKAALHARLPSTDLDK